MFPFTFSVANNPDAAIADAGNHPGAKYLAGGTNLIDEMKLGIDRPARLIDVKKLPLGKIEATGDGGIRIGATVTNTDLAYDDSVRKKYPALSEAILSGASPQLRNAATTAGNLLQHTRCVYYRDGFSPCNKRQPGSGCAAIGGFNRSHAVLGTSEKCIAVHPSDMDVALMAYEAVIHTRSPRGERTIPIDQFYVAYGEDPAKENTLEPGELITAVDLPNTAWFARSTYVKARDRASYEFALASAAVALDISGTRVRDCRIAIGGVATKPWRAVLAEQALKGASLNDDAYFAAAQAEMAKAVPQKYNAFKVLLCRNVIVRALQKAAKVA